MSKPYVAIVDDDSGFAAYLRTFLSLRGYEARCYTRGDELLASMKQTEAPDVVLLDVMMPGMNGLDTLRALKTAKPDLQVIMLSGREQAATIVEAVRLGAADYVVKPDDPEGLGEIALDNMKFYLKVGAQYEKDKDVIVGTAPHFELNYGPLPDLQLHLLAPFAYAKPEGEASQRGYGDTELGVKYRFLNNETSHFMAGTFPIVELPTGNSDKGLGAGHTQIFLPLWLQKAWGPWQSYGGGGYWRNPGDGNKDYWFFGWQLQRQISQLLTLGAELFGNTKTADDGKSRIGFNAGAIVNLTDDHHLLFSAGSDIRGDNRLSAYFAYQYTFGPHEGKNK